ncbi:hypothetical protein [Streptomyces sp. NBRC 110465]|uniref:hypothetical protein n=1 Tax=Streptomyces sp. NBRC 110465 TaxID=1897621 RepID=UPI000932E78A|nr:hypothetical protein [Streptomyces sp. NBRC 110465]
MIRCEIAAHRLDLSAYWPLYAYEADSPREALRWARWRARMLADQLDPDPWALWVPAGALRPVPESVPDAPAELRGWCEDWTTRLEAMHLLMEGQQVTLAVHDDTAHYTVTVVPDLPEAVS